MKQHQDDHQNRWVFGLLFLGALTLRLVLLDRFPLREVESRQAYQAWALWKGLPAETGPRTLYLSITEGIYSLLGSSAFTARLWPAVGGALLVWVPFGFRRDLGNLEAMVWAAGLAVDPGLLMGSRFAGSPLPAAALVLGGVLLIRSRRPGWGIFSLGLALLAGPPFWYSLLVFWVGLAFTHWFGPGDILGAIRKEIRELRSEVDNRADLLRLIGLPLVGLVLMGTFRLSALEGLTAWFSGLTEYLGGFRNGSRVPAGQILAALAAYQPLAVGLGGSEAVRSWFKDDSRGKQLSLWFAASLLIAVVYPGRQTIDLVWALIPLYGLVGQLVGRTFREPAAVPVVPYILATFSLVMLSLSWMSFTGMISRSGQTQAVLLQGVIILVALVLTGIAGAITAAEWDWRTARAGLLLGLGGGLMLYTLAVGVGGAYLRMNDPRELWIPGRGTEDLDLLESTLQDVSLQVTGRRTSVHGAVFTESSLLKWHFRDYPELEFYPTYQEELRPPVFIIDERSVKQVATDAYLGQDFLVATSPGWLGALPSPWLNWLAFREGLLEEHRYVLWVRRDVLPGGDLLLSGGETPGEGLEGLP